MNQSASRITGFVPAYNAADTVGHAVSSLRNQSCTSLEVLVIDDASTDETPSIAEKAGARVVSMPVNSGRGAVRARGVELLEADFIVSLDAGNQVAPDFLENIMPLFDDPLVGAVVGHWWESPQGLLTQRWRARHLFRTDRQAARGKPCHLATHGCVLRRTAVLKTGNFNPTLRHTEDAVLGYSMKRLGFKILACPEAKVTPQRVDNLAQLAKRYWRWQAGAREPWSLARYWSRIRNSFLVMAPRDLRARDFPSLVLTLLMPHWIALYTLKRKLGRKSHP